MPETKTIKRTQKKKKQVRRAGIDITPQPGKKASDPANIKKGQRKSGEQTKDRVRPQAKLRVLKNESQQSTTPSDSFSKQNKNSISKHRKVAGKKTAIKASQTKLKTGRKAGPKTVTKKATRTHKQKAA